MKNGTGRSRTVWTLPRALPRDSPGLGQRRPSIAVPAAIRSRSEPPPDARSPPGQPRLRTMAVSGLRAVSRPSEGLATAVRKRSARKTGLGGFPARSAVGVRGVGALATPTPLCDQTHRPPVAACGFRAVSRPSEGLATAVRRRCARKTGRGGFPARSAVGVRGVGALATPTPLCDQTHRPPVAASGFRAVSRPSEGLATAVRKRSARKTGRGGPPRGAPSECGG